MFPRDPGFTCLARLMCVGRCTITFTSRRPVGLAARNSLTARRFLGIDMDGLTAGSICDCPHYFGSLSGNDRGRRRVPDDEIAYSDIGYHITGRRLYGSMFV